MDFTTGKTAGTMSMRAKAALLYLLVSGGVSAQCDLEILDVDLIDGYVTVAFNNTEGCGGTGGPDGVSEIQFGFQALDEDCNAMNQGWDLPSGFSLSPEANHPGWVYSATSTESNGNWTNLYSDDIDPPYYTGDTVSFPIYNQYQSDCVDGPYAYGLYCQLENVIDYWLSLDLSIQTVIWQISYGPTMYAEDGGWAEVGANGDGTSSGSGLYEDQNFQDNWLISGQCGDCIPEVVSDTVYVEVLPDTVFEYVYDTAYVELPPDTVIVLDTLPVPINWYFFDTTYIYVTDTSYITLTDTLYITDIQIDTLVTYEYDMVEVDCSTGEPCINPFSDCEIYIPNAFSPDNDGVNDVWYVETEEDCWNEWRMKVFSRNGEVIWESYNPSDIWLGGDEYYVPADTYIYRVECEGYGESYIISGHLTILR